MTWIYSSCQVSQTRQDFLWSISRVGIQAHLVLLINPLTLVKNLNIVVSKYKKKLYDRWMNDPFSSLTSLSQSSLIVSLPPAQCSLISSPPLLSLCMMTERIIRKKTPVIRIGFRDRKWIYDWIYFLSCVLCQWGIQGSYLNSTLVVCWYHTDSL